MTRKDYEMIANGIKETLVYHNLDLDTWILMVHGIRAVLRKDNERFDDVKFINACGWEYAYGFPYVGIVTQVS